jgi:ribokinase
MAVPQIIVVGSHTPGLFIRVHRIPVAGETVLGWDYQEPIDGGKGSHQAMVAARLGASTSFVGCLGKDRLGQTAVEWLRDAGVDMSHLAFSETKSTAVGFILLNDEGVPAMVSTLGANEEVDESLVDRALADFSPARLLLTQFEIRPAVAIHAARAARRQGMTAIINPAPAYPVALEQLSAAHILTPNESEAKVLLGYPSQVEIAPARLAVELRQHSGVDCVMVTAGEQGVAGIDASGEWLCLPPKVEAVDTSGAGDVFCGALAVGRLKGWSNQQAAGWACKVAALSVTRSGTIPAFPTAQEVEEIYG